jgi:endonuclease YncB( thermonuclease family)
MGRGMLAKLKRRKQMLARAAGFALAAGTVCAALFAGAMLRETSRPSSPPTSGGAAQDAKDVTRVIGALERAPPAEAVAQAASPSAPQSSGAEPGAWREAEFAFVGIVDGRTLHAGGVTLTVAGLELPHPDQICRTLDDRLESCAARAATQLELLTRSRRLACRYRMTTSSAATGSCRVGSRDLAERMIRTGYARAGSGTVIADASGSEAAGR